MQRSGVRQYRPSQSSSAAVFIVTGQNKGKMRFSFLFLLSPKQNHKNCTSRQGKMRFLFPCLLPPKQKHMNCTSCHWKMRLSIPFLLSAKNTRTVPAATAKWQGQNTAVVTTASKKACKPGRDGTVPKTKIMRVRIMMLRRSHLVICPWGLLRSFPNGIKYRIFSSTLSACTNGCFTATWEPICPDNQ